MSRYSFRILLGLQLLQGKHDKRSKEMASSSACLQLLVLLGMFPQLLQNARSKYATTISLDLLSEIQRRWFHDAVAVRGNRLLKGNKLTNINTFNFQEEIK